MHKVIIAMVLLAVLTGVAQACDLKVDSAWIREAPPNAMALAGYAKLGNTGAAALKIQTISSPAFASIETHESFTENGLAKMRPIAVEISAKGAVEFAAGGKHFMLMGPKQPLKKGDVVTVKISDATGCITSVPFKVGAMPESQAHDHSTMDHSTMDHSKMNHSDMKSE
jgi:periplasmic copper chaperone A